MIRAGAVEMFNAEGAWEAGRQRSSFSRVSFAALRRSFGWQRPKWPTWGVGFCYPTSSPAAGAGAASLLAAVAAGGAGLRW